MLQPNRHGSSDNYRYGYNGKEKDDEIKGEGVQYDYGFRIYDARIARFLSTDPLFKGFPFYTPYQFAGNKPIIAIDLDGLEEARVTRSRHIRQTIVLHGNNQQFGKMDISLNGKIINVDAGSTVVITPGYEGSAELIETVVYRRMQKWGINGRRAYRVSSTLKTNKATAPMPTPVPAPVPAPKPVEKEAYWVTEDVYEDREITVTRNREVESKKNINLDISFEYREAHYKNYSGAREIIDPILDKLKTNPSNRLKLTVNVRSSDPDASVGWNPFYDATDLAEDRVDYMSQELQKYNVPLDQYEINYTIDPNKPYGVTGVLTTYETVNEEITTSETERVKVGTKRVKKYK
ncbi:RHS repeat-associated protein [Seonamhaeicola aphaedonensis]|uniref:RHS repeat-associated protein n=2 Tax=Seonamhaeicola aphaedonensis TaxID=1461338 RepID=A0A3D9H817_9FLAO|nr:RHS repeat-associated protein [Seonamhaeicola aphaedonensis]